MKDKAVTIRRDEWLKALGDAIQVSDPDALTINEIAEQFGISRCKAAERMQTLVQQKKAVRVFKRIPRENGSPYLSPAYKLLRK